MTTIESISTLLVYLTAAGGILVTLTLLALILSKTKLKSSVEKPLAWIKDNPLLIAFIVSLIATSGSLFYSEIAQYTPCKLCWFERIFMYPLVLISGIALYTKDLAAKKYILGMSLIGALIALYHYGLQVYKIIFPNLEIPTNCGVVGYAPACSDYFLLKLGYITIPMMCLTAFVMIIIALSLNCKKK
jgi:disulfide bond formation protein DsbB